MAPRKLKQPEQSQQPVPESPPSLPQWLEDETDTLKEMIEWWKSRESAKMEASLRRPIFSGKTRNTGIRVNTVILNRAIDKSKEEKLKTGGNLSQLVEWLLWVYIGAPDDVVDRD